MEKFKTYKFATTSWGAYLGKNQEISQHLLQKIPETIITIHLKRSFSNHQQITFPNLQNHHQYHHNHLYPTKPQIQKDKKAAVQHHQINRIITFVARYIQRKRSDISVRIVSHFYALNV